MDASTKFSQSAAVTRCRSVKELKLKAQHAIASLADEEATIHTANLTSAFQRLSNQLSENAALEQRQADACKGSQQSSQRKLQLSKLIDKLTEIKALLRFQEEQREREIAFKASTRQKRAAFQARLARMEDRHTAERTELFQSQKRLSETVQQIRAVEIKSIKDKTKARQFMREHEIQAQQNAMRQQKESEFLRELQASKIRQMAEINDLEMSNMEELEDLVTHNRNEEFHLLNKHAKAEAELLSNLEIQMQLSEAAELAEKQKSVQQSQLRAQKKQTAAIAKSYAIASKNREKMLICDNPILKGTDSAGATEKDQADIEGSVGSKLGMNLTAEDNAIIKISGERANLGIIMAANDNFNKLFGYYQGEVVGRNINMIVPSPFSELHDGFLRKYLDTGSSRVIDVFQQVMGVHKDGYLLPIILCVKHNQEADGKRAFAGYIKAAKESKTSGFIIFDSNTLRLKYATKNIEDTFSFKVSQMGGSSSVGQLFPGLDETTIKEVSTHRGFESEVKVGDQVLNIRVRGDKIQVQEFALHICGVSFKQNGVEMDDEGALDLPMTFYEGDDADDSKADEQGGHNGASNVGNTEKDTNAISDAGSERLRAMVHHHKTVLNELKRQHRAVFSQKSKEHRRKMSDLLKDHEEENEQLKVEQSAALKELLETQLQSAAMQLEHPTAQKLSGSVVPPHIADKLELGIEPEPERIECLTLLVVEIADFKKFTDEIPPARVFSILNELHAKFDDIIAKYPSLCKIDSTASVYLVAAGFPVSQVATPVEIAASAAQALDCSAELQTLVKNLDISDTGLRKKLSLQIGIHSGEATAGLIGTKVSHYCLFGDSVATASQLCSTAESGKVQVSMDTIVALGANEKFEFELRGDVSIKGKGKITSYWLEGC